MALSVKRGSDFAPCPWQLFECIEKRKREMIWTKNGAKMLSASIYRTNTKENV